MSRKIVNYKILKEKYEEIDDEVREHINKGWQPFGQPYPYRLGLAQAMIKYEESELLNNKEIKDLINDIIKGIDVKSIENFSKLLKQYLSNG